MNATQGIGLFDLPLMTHTDGLMRYKVFWFFYIFVRSEYVILQYFRGPLHIDLLKLG